MARVAWLQWLAFNRATMWCSVVDPESVRYSCLPRPRDLFRVYTHVASGHDANYVRRVPLCAAVCCVGT